MAEFMNLQRSAPVNSAPNAGFNAIGKPVPFYRREAGFQSCKHMGLETEDAYSVVGMVSEKLERDEPHAAIEHSMKYLDLTGSYRLVSILLTAERPPQP